MLFLGVLGFYSFSLVLRRRLTDELAIGSKGERGNRSGEGKKVEVRRKFDIDFLFDYNDLQKVNNLFPCCFSEGTKRTLRR